MKYKIYIIAAICCSSIISSCSSNAALSSRRYSQAFIFEELCYPELPELCSFVEEKPGEIYRQEVEITDTFTAYEKRYIAVPDDKLFEKTNTIVFNLDQFALEEFVFPLRDAKVTSGYGRRAGRTHSGIDIKTTPHDTIRAAFAGIIRVAGRTSGYGNVIVIRHYNGLETVYAHNSKHFVSSGDRVEAGTPIGLSGRTGRAYGDHVHFETRINGEHFDPNLLIDFKNYTLKPRSIVFVKKEKGNITVKPVI